MVVTFPALGADIGRPVAGVTRLAKWFEMGGIPGRVLAPDMERYQRLVPPDVCCTRMAAALSQACPQHDDPFECPDNLLYWSPPLDEYGLIVHDGGASYVLVAACPWCGRKLPDSRREQWFVELEKLGYDSPLVDEVPAPFDSDRWYRDGPRQA